jgi:hypothetical protein
MGTEAGYTIVNARTIRDEWRQPITAQIKTMQTS